jgi:hypothetical protein
MNFEQVVAVLGMVEGTADVDDVKETFDEQTETEELESNMTESEVYYDEDAEELRLREAEDTEETEELEETEDTEIEELRAVYQNYRDAGWEGPANRARSELVAALSEQRSDIDTEIDDLHYTSDDEEELKEERRELTQEIEELRR